MNNMRIYKKIIYAMLAFVIVFVSSCSNDKYMNAIPADCMAVGYAEFSNDDSGNGLDAKNLLISALGMDMSDQLGVDFEQKVFFFETNDGLFGLCAKIDDKDELLNKLKLIMLAERSSNKVHEYKDYHFAVIRNSWMAGISDDALLLVGPVINAQYKTTEQRMAKWMDADEDKSIVSKPIFQCLDSINAPTALVTQLKAIPEQFRLPFTIGMPKDADASQVLLALTMNFDGDIVDLQGEIFSFNEQVDKALKDATSSFRPISEKYVKTMEKETMAALFLNAEGGGLLELLRSNQSCQMLLAGANTTIDMDNILRCIDGDLVFMLSSLHGQQPEIAMGAELKSAQFLNDVGYWKKSCPQGTRIVDFGNNAFKISNSSTNYYFGVGPNNHFYAGTTENLANSGQQQAKNPIDSSLSNRIIGKKLCLTVNLHALTENTDYGDMISSFLRPVFGKSKTIVYHLK